MDYNHRLTVDDETRAERIERAAVELRDFLAARFKEHDACEDPWYSCPKNPDYIGGECRDYCNCGKDEMDRLIAAFDAARRGEG